MAGSPMRVWNEWAIQVLVLLSFALQAFLLAFAWIRRREGSAALKLLLWLAYLTADSTAVYTLGHLSISWLRSGRAPFLLLHLGSQDTITAYALVDNQLWLRHLLTLVVQALGAAYVLYKHVAGGGAAMVAAALLMFVVGVVKYGERIWALKCSSMDGIRSSAKREQLGPRPHPEPRLPRGQRVDRDEEELLLFAHSQFHVSKHAMVYSSIDPNSARTVTAVSVFTQSWNSKDACRLMELELSLVWYDFMYTKAVQ
jgi:hypothetical protein